MKPFSAQNSKTETCGGLMAARKSYGSRHTTSGCLKSVYSSLSGFKTIPGAVVSLINNGSLVTSLKLCIDLDL
jgi:hypothetical protein